MVLTIVSIIIGLAVLSQLYFFLKTLRNIKLFKKVVPTIDGLKTIKVYLPQTNDLSAEQILAQKDKHMLAPDQRIAENEFFDHVVKSSNKL